MRKYHRTLPMAVLAGLIVPPAVGAGRDGADRVFINGNVRTGQGGDHRAWAIGRMTPGGTPPGGWFPENRIGAQAASRHFTVDTAYASSDPDVTRPPDERLLTARILLTAMGGRDTHRAKDVWR